MTEESYKRKLTAILSADVEGYSRLMGDDEDATIKTLTTYRELMTTLIDKHRGRVVDSPGDNLLAEFSSIVDAVRCAVEIQEELRIRNAELPEHRRMHFRIGINLGDVVQEEERIYGDGINIAARVEGLAEGGGICISGTVYDSIKNKLSLSYESLGEHTVKNITEPVRVYRMRVGPDAAAQVEKEEKPHPKPWRKPALAALVVLIVAAGAWAIWNFYFRPPPIEPASEEKMAYTLPDKPSIAVMPFLNMTGDQSQDFLCDGMSESLITALSKVPQLFVIARKTTFSYKGKAVKVSQVSEELGVKYVLEGSVQKSGDRVRVTAQLIDALKGNHLWADRYDRELKELFAVLDDITKNIITALHVKLASGKSAIIYAKGTEDLEAYLKVLEGLWYLGQSTKDGIERARQLSDEAIALDPKFPTAYFALGAAHMLDALTGFSKNPIESLGFSNKMFKKAIKLDETFAVARATRSFTLIMLRRYDEALAEAEQAYDFSPNNSVVLYFYGTLLFTFGKYEEAVSPLKEALRLDPIPPNSRLRSLGCVYGWGLGQYEEAIAYMQRAVKRQPNDILSRVILTSILSLAGQEEEANSSAKEVLRVYPKFSVDQYIRTISLKDQATSERVAQALKKAGLPEKPPLPLPDKPSIAVLPFVNMSADPEQEYFSDGITEEIITALSKIPKLFVIARTSSFKYKGKKIDIRTVGRELGVRYVLEGSVRKAGDEVRITAQLIDAKTNKHLWAERYDRDLKYIFAIQDDITKNIITALQVNLTIGENARLFARGTESLEAYLRVLQGLEFYWHYNSEGNAKARQIFKEAISLDPDYPEAYARLGWTHWIDVWFRFGKSPRDSMKQAFQSAKKAIALDDSLPTAHGLLASLYMLTREHERAISEAEKAVALSPNLAELHAYLGQILSFAGKPEEAILHHERSIRLDPFARSSYFHLLGMAYREAGRYEEAITACQKAIQRQPNNFFAHLILASTYIMIGREDEARAEAAEVLRINPKFSVEQFVKVRPHIDPANTARFADALRKAGLK